jgi:hypothetical protein
MRPALAVVSLSFVFANPMVRLLFVAVKLVMVEYTDAVAVTRLALAVTVSCWGLKDALALW